MDSTKITIIIPTFNEVDNIPSLLERISNLHLDIKVLFIDDNSPDGTAELINKLKSQYSFIELLSKPTKEGLGAAYKTGFAHALKQGADIVGEMDADLSHQPEDLPTLIKASADGAQVVIGSRRIAGGKIVGWSAFRRLESIAATIIARLLLGLKTRDITSGFRLYDKQALEKIPWTTVTTSGYAWQEELLYYAEKLKLDIVEVPITFTDRQRGVSKLSINDIIEFFSTILRLKFRR